MWMGECKEEKKKGGGGEKGAHGVECAPPAHEAGRLSGRYIEGRVLERLISGENDYERERNDRQEEQATDQPVPTSAKPPGPKGRKPADESERRLHESATLIAGTPFGDGERDAAHEPSGLLDKRNVDGGAAKKA